MCASAEKKTAHSRILLYTQEIGLTQVSRDETVTKEDM